MLRSMARSQRRRQLRRGRLHWRRGPATPPKSSPAPTTSPPRTSFPSVARQAAQERIWRVLEPLLSIAIVDPLHVQQLPRMGQATSRAQPNGTPRHDAGGRVGGRNPTVLARQLDIELPPLRVWELHEAAQAKQLQLREGELTKPGKLVHRILGWDAAHHIIQATPLHQSGVPLGPHGCPGG